MNQPHDTGAQDLTRFSLPAPAGQAPCSALIRPVAPGEAAQVLALQDLAIGDLMFPITAQEVRDLLAGGQGCILGVWVAEELVAFLAITVPDLGEHNLGHDAGLPAEALPGIAQWTAVIVHPGYRGHGLHLRLLRHSLDRLDWPRVRRWLTTVRCENRFSLHNFLAVGATVVARMRKYDGHERFLLMLEWPADCGALADLE